MPETHDRDFAQIAALAARYRATQAPPGFSARVMAQVAVPGRLFQFWRPAWALAAVLIVAVLIALPHWGETPPPAPVAQDEPVRLATPTPERVVKPAPSVAVVEPQDDDGVAQTRILSEAAQWLAASQVDVPAVSEIPDAMSVQSLAEIPDPFSET